MNHYVKQHEYFTLNNFSAFGASAEVLVLDSRYHGKTVKNADGSSHNTVDISLYCTNMTEEEKSSGPV